MALGSRIEIGTEEPAFIAVGKAAPEPEAGPVILGFLLLSRLEHQEGRPVVVFGYDRRAGRGALPQTHGIVIQLAHVPPGLGGGKGAETQAQENCCGYASGRGIKPSHPLPPCTCDLS